jgi:hypothetical protein
LSFAAKGAAELTQQGRISNCGHDPQRVN